MDSGWLVLIEAVLVFGLILGFGVWQLISIRRMEREDRAKAEAAKAEAASAQRPGHPERQHQPDQGAGEAVER